MMLRLIVAVTVLLLLEGCGRMTREARAELERQAAGRIVKYLWLYEARFPERGRTNLAEIFDTIGHGYPYDLHEKFARYGQKAGFRNSFYEKYAFPQTSFSNQTLRAEVVLVSAEPYQNERGQMVRIAILRSGEGFQNWRFESVEENQLKAFFDEAGVAIPPKASMPSPTPAASSGRRIAPLANVRDFFTYWAGNLGMGRGSWWILLVAAVIALGSLGATIAIFIRRTR